LLDQAIVKVAKVDHRAAIARAVKARAGKVAVVVPKVTKVETRVRAQTAMDQGTAHRVSGMVMEAQVIAKDRATAQARATEGTDIKEMGQRAMGLKEMGQRAMGLKEMGQRAMDLKGTYLKATKMIILKAIKAIRTTTNASINADLSHHLFRQQTHQL
jgi:hypothetical protein